MVRYITLAGFTLRQSMDCQSAAFLGVSLSRSAMSLDFLANCMTQTLTYPHRVHLAWWSSRTVYVPGGLEFEPQRLRGFFGFPGV